LKHTNYKLNYVCLKTRVIANIATWYTRHVYETFTAKMHSSETETLDILSETRLKWDVFNLWVRDETETLQVPTPWPRRAVKPIEHHHYGPMSQMVF